MEKELVIERLNKTLEKLEQLKPEEFNYYDYVTDGNENCATVGCIAGWYPKWFPEAGIRYGGNPVCLIETDKFNGIAGALQEYHGLSNGSIKILFYGDSGYSIENSSRNDLAGVIKVWEKFILGYELGLII